MKRYSSKYGKYAWGDILSTTSAGAISGSTFGPWGAGIGGAVGLVGGFMNQDALDKENKLTKDIQYRQLVQQSQGILSNYPSQGIPQAMYGMRLNFGRLFRPNFMSGMNRMMRIGNCGCGQGRNKYKQGGKYSWKWNPSEYPTNWAEGGNHYPNGGGLPVPTDNSEATRLASDTMLYNGATHENGGIDLDINKDGHKDIELENNEVIQDDKVLSDRLYPSDELKDHVRQLGVNIQSGDTYANIAERLGKKKGNWEEKINSTLLGEATAAEKMIGKYDLAMELLFNDQQNQKGMEEQNQEFGKGGHWIQKAINPKHKGYCTPMTKSTCTGRRRALALTFKKHHGFHKKGYGGYLQDGGPVPLYKEGDPRFNDEYAHNQFYINRAKTMLSPEDQKAYSTMQVGQGLTPQQQYSADVAFLTSRFDFPQYSQKQVDYKVPVHYQTYNNPKSVEYQKDSALIDKIQRKAYGGHYEATDSPYVSPFFVDDSKVKGFNPNGGNKTLYWNGGYYDDGGEVEPKVPFGQKLKDFTEDNYGNIASVAGFLGNEIYRNNLKTSFEPSLAPTPTNTFTDRTNYITNRNLAHFRAATQGVNASSAQDNLGLKNQLYASSLEGTNEQIDREQQRKDAYMQQYNQQALYNNMFNTQNINQAKMYGLQMKNQKIGLGQQNYSNLIHSFIGNRAMKEAQDLDVAKTYMKATEQADTGIADRLNEQLGKVMPRNFRRRYGWNRKPTTNKVAISSDNSEVEDAYTNLFH